MANQVLQILGTALVTGLFSGTGLFLGNYLWHRYKEPKLEIETNLTFVESSAGTFTSHVKVRNKGKTAAKDCKAFLLYGGYEAQPTWIRGRDKVTINAYDYEFIDGFILDKATSRVTVNSLPILGLGQTGSMPITVIQNTDMTLRISSANAKSIEREIHILISLNANKNFIEFT